MSKSHFLEPGILNLHGIKKSYTPVINRMFAEILANKVDFCHWNVLNRADSFVRFHEKVQRVLN